LEPGFQQFATADLVCGGRVEIIFGRGALTDYLPIFFFDINEYDALIIGKLHLFGELNEKDHVTGSGRFRPPLRKAEIAPRPPPAKLPVCIGAGSPDIVARAARLGFPQVPPMLGWTLSHFAGLAAIDRQAWRDRGRTPRAARAATFWRRPATQTPEETRRGFYPTGSAYPAPLLKGPLPPATFAQRLSPRGGRAGGRRPAGDRQVIDHRPDARGARCVGQPFAVARSIELFAAKVAPVLRREAGSRDAKLRSAAVIRRCRRGSFYRGSRAGRIGRRGGSSWEPRASRLRGRGNGRSGHPSLRGSAATLGPFYDMSSCSKGM
jgi:hypothetical protein